MPGFQKLRNRLEINRLNLLTGSKAKLPSPAKQGHFEGCPTREGLQMIWVEDDRIGEGLGNVTNCDKELLGWDVGVRVGRWKGSGCGEDKPIVAGGHLFS